ncbi:MAG TPA: polyprenyl diphosphate synthase, partial [Candidatus Saccharimonadales bacterium]|nr:polyprenyl diphosphate synthase [Candidatus Saccharimonadales bacterium]
LPQHVGYIIDGNRRWAKAHGLPKYEGHLAGYNAIKQTVIDTIGSGVKFVSVFVFSTENWKREAKEVENLMQLTLRLAKVDVKELIDHDIRVLFVGSREGLSDKLNAAIDESEAKTAHLTAGTVCICFNYGGHREVVDAVKAIVREGTHEADVTDQLITDHLYQPDVPPIDIVVRTSGEQRISNFMLWRIAYSELLFLEKNWPDMTKQDVAAILEEYTRRKRRFGG